MDSVLPLALFAFASSATPGPNNIMVMTSGVNFGFKRTLPHVAGIASGLAVMVLLVGTGLGAAFAASKEVHATIRVAGAAYLVWLAWKVASSGPPTKGTGSDAPSRPLGFFGAAAFQWVNPKAWMMALGGIGAFVPREDAAQAVATLAAVFALVCVPCVGAWALFGARLRFVLAKPRALRIFNVTMAILLLASLVPMFLP